MKKKKRLFGTFLKEKENYEKNIVILNKKSENTKKENEKMKNLKINMKNLKKKKIN